MRSDTELDARHPRPVRPWCRSAGWTVGLGIFLFAWTLTTHGKYSASGDEPHYLMITHSIVVDHDMDVGNNYANNDGRFLGHDGLEMGLHAVPARSGRLRSIHNVGVAVALVPVYAVAQRLAALPPDSLLARFRMGRGLLAYSIISVFLIGVTVTGLVLLSHAISDATGDARLATVVVLVAGVSPPVVSQSFLVFPEVPALFVTCLVVWLCLKTPSQRDSTALLWVAFALGLLPWAHNKFLIYVPGLVAAIVLKRRALVRGLSTWQRALVLAFVAGPPLLLQAWVWREWGTLGGALTTSAVPFSLDMLKTGLPGLLVDRQSGLLAYAPVYLLLPAAWYLTRHRSWPWLVPAALLYVPAASFTIGWWAGFSPAARYIAPLAPMFLVVLADGLCYRPVRVAALFLTVGQLAIDAVVWQRPRALWPAADRNPALDALGWLGRSYEAVLPATQSALPVGAASLALAAWLALTLMLVLLSGEARAFSGLTGRGDPPVPPNRIGER